MWFDIICIIVILAGFTFGYRRGILAQTGSIIGVVAGIILCRVFAGSLASGLVSADKSVQSVLVANIMSYIIIFAACYIVGRLLGTAAGGLLKALKLGIVDKFAGAVFTAGEYLLFFSLLLNAWIAAVPSTRILSDYDGLKEFAIGFAPAVLGNQYVVHTFRTVADSLTSAL